MKRGMITACLISSMILTGITISEHVKAVEPTQAITGQATHRDYWNPDHTPVNYNVLNAVKAMGAWDQGFRGEGTVIAVIDGTTVPHKDFKLTDDTAAKISQEDSNKFISEKGYGKYVNSKIPFFYNYASESTDYSQLGADADHGIHVSGLATANGNPDDEKFAVGTSPEAQIVAMRVVDNTSAENSRQLAKAINDAIDLDVDAINLSVGTGVGDNDKQDIVNQAIQRATQKGITVTAAASNSGYGGWYHTGMLSASGQKVVNSGTISNTATNDNVLAVANKIVDSSSLSQTSSWGPAADLTLKPDVLAPGASKLESTSWNDGYSKKDGTSMASPTVSGISNLVKQKLLKTTKLQGEKLTQVANSLLMNSGKPIKDTYFKLPYLPRQQGAGLIDADNAISRSVVAQDTKKNTGSVSLYQIGQETKFTVRLTNFGTKDVQYTYEPASGPLTGKFVSASEVTEKIAGAALTPENQSFTVKAGEEKLISFVLDVGSELNENNYVEGYLNLKSNDGNNDISMPYLGYYGDTTQESVFEMVPNKGIDPYLIDDQNYPLGVGGRQDTIKAVQSLNKTPEAIVEDKAAFSPNNDGSFDEVWPVIYSKQNLKAMTTKVKDSSGKVIKTVDQENRIEKSIVTGGNFVDVSQSQSMILHDKALAWDGTTYDPSTGLNTVVPDGKYQYEVSGDLINPGANTTQTKIFKFMVDTKKPVLSHLETNNGTLKFDYSDEGAGFTKNSRVWITATSGETTDMTLNNSGSINNGHFEQAVSAPIKTVMLSDVAGNETSYEVTPNGNLVETLVKKQPKDSGLQLPGHGTESGVQGEPNKDYLGFDDLLDNGYTFIGKQDKSYDPTTETMAITGKVTDKTKELKILGHSSYESDEKNQVQLNEDGTFSYQFKIKNKASKSLGYIIGGVDGTVVHGTLELVIDTNAPTITLNSVKNKKVTRLTTTKANYHLSGLVNDDVEGVTFSINGDMKYRGKNGSRDGDANRVNVYGPYEFTEEVPLKVGVNYITVRAEDQVGNITERVIEATREK